jgi:mannose-1-phosphate guanylyltransferase/mannose-6-phosphate isomerase
LNHTLIPVVMSGGSGTRLWPLSTDGTPKQFHALGPPGSLIQQTVQRLRPLAGLEVVAPIVVGSQRHADILDAQLGAIGCSACTIVLEPFGRNTAAVAAIAALVAHASAPEALVLLAPADHVIPDGAGFSAAIATAAPTAAGRIVTFGVRPTGPETGYGYIEGGEVIAGPVRTVRRFTEKPDLDTARRYIADGRHLWNAGIFLFSPEVMIHEMQRWAPDVMAACRRALSLGRRDGTRIILDGKAFADCPSISIDCAVMEKTDRAAVAPIGVDWADVGSWSELWRLGPRDEHENFVRGDVLLIDTEGALVWADSKTVGTIGVRDLIVVQTKDAVIVLPKSRAQDVKKLVDLVKARRTGHESGSERLGQGEGVACGPGLAALGGGWG